MKTPKFYYVYIITNLLLNKQYVGSKVCYKNDPLNDEYWGSSQYLDKDYVIYGKHNFKKEILKLDCKDKIEMLNEEANCIIKYNTLAPNGYNHYLPNQRIGFNMIGISKIPWNKGKKLSEEHKQKLKKPKSEEHKRKVALTKIGNTYTKGQKRSEQTKQKMRNSKLGTKHTDEHNRNFSKARKGVSITPTIKILCPHCNNLIDKRNFSRWHGNKCKLNNN